MSTINGGCRCGKVRYTIDAEPAFVGVCHCTACQKAGGSAFAVVIAFPSPSLRVNGNVSTYDTIGDSGKGVHYRFCPNCGSPITSNVDVLPDLMMIRAGTLDDPSWVKPGMEIYCDSKQPWVTLGGGLKAFAKMPS